MKPRMKPFKLYIARISYGDEPLHCHALLQLQKRLLQTGVEHSFAVPFYDSLITRGRNRAAANFLRSDSTHMLTIDADISFAPEDVERLIEAAKGGLEFSGAPYPMKEPTGKLWVGSVRQPINLRADGFVEADDIGGGFTLISRDALDLLAEHAPKAAWDWPGATGEDKYSVFYDTGIDEGRYLSEDWWIARAYRACGGTCWLDARAALGHIGKITYRSVATLEASILHARGAEETEAAQDAEAYWGELLRTKAGE